MATKTITDPDIVRAITADKKEIESLRQKLAKLSDDNRELHLEIQFLKSQQDFLLTALDRIAKMKNRDGYEIEMHRDELRAIAKTALGKK